MKRSDLADALRAVSENQAALLNDARKARLVIELTNGAIMMLPPRLLQGLENASPSELAKVRLTPLGFGLHWELLDADLSVAGLAAGVFGSNA